MTPGEEVARGGAGLGKVSLPSVAALLPSLCPETTRKEAATCLGWPGEPGPSAECPVREELGCGCCVFHPPSNLTINFIGSYEKVSCALTGEEHRKGKKEEKKRIYLPTYFGSLFFLRERARASERDRERERAARERKSSDRQPPPPPSPPPRQEIKLPQLPARLRRAPRLHRPEWLTAPCPGPGPRTPPYSDRRRAAPLSTSRLPESPHRHRRRRQRRRQQPPRERRRPSPGGGERRAATSSSSSSFPSSSSTSSSFSSSSSAAPRLPLCLHILRARSARTACACARACVRVREWGAVCRAIARVSASCVCVSGVLLS
ncbi:serine/arginine repetitive matrix protein 1-like [Molothrus ater]|uniref:serine/arginine repetitive matrix protein 1-like n=1 Tax=Molothrus ater TaxID=84834 RepID=UPI0023E8DB75|nr:serine/arginine repetitive matrix protein 1-like [Molothrus ater]